ncbi:MAG: tRNA-dihydrouridine synthase [Candidatus Levybacteria bacterium]|nr:tRNA-dihydrouridine synthase [Candidatus Levybacteria bacterium]
MKTFWEKLQEKTEKEKKPFLVQAPMENVTDVVFREMINICGRPDVFFTEFTNTDGLCSRGKDGVSHRLQFTKNQHPIVAQIWGNNPENYYQSAMILKKQGFDGIDINMGCPDRDIVKKGSCAGLINNNSLVREIYLATKEGAGNLPISIKTRLGLNKIETEKWIGFLLGLDLAALTIHGRIAKEMSKFPANWEEIGKVVKIRNEMEKKTIIIGNGDIQNKEEAFEKYEKYHVDGIMIGRGIFSNLWVFNRDNENKIYNSNDKLNLLIKHITLFENTWKNKKPFEVMKKFYKIYISDFPNASDFRLSLMEAKDSESSIAMIKNKINENII